MIKYLLLLPLLSVSLLGANKYIAPAGSGGNDSNDGSIGSPFLTVKHAIGEIAANDTLFFRSGTYVEAAITVAADEVPSGTTDYTKLVGYPGETAVIKLNDASSIFRFPSTTGARTNIWFENLTFDFANSTGASMRHGLDLESITTSVITNCTFRNGYSTSMIVLGDNTAGTGADGLVVTGCTFDNFGSTYPISNGPQHAIYFAHWKNSVLTNCVFTSSIMADGTYAMHLYNGGTGVPLGWGVNNTVAYNRVLVTGGALAIVDSMYGSGSRVFNNFFATTSTTRRVAVLWSSDNIAIDNNTFYGGSYSLHVSEYGTTSGNRIRNNIFAGAASGSINVLATEANFWTNNLYATAGGVGWAAQTVSGSVIATPTFTSPPTDLRWTSTSPALNAGTDLSSTITDDFYGTVRPSGGSFDIGAYEAGSASLYVSTTGYDTAGGGTIGAPWRTIRYGVLNMAAGDTLWLRGGTYEEPRIGDNVVKSGPSNAQRTTISSYPGEIAKYKPTIADEKSSYHVFYNYLGSNITFSSFWIDGSNHEASYRQRYMISTRASVNLTLTNMVFTNAPWNSMVSLDLPAGSTFAPAGSNTLVAGCTFTRMGYMLDGSANHGAVALYPKGHVDIVITNNVFTNFAKSYTYASSQAHRAIQMTRAIDRVVIANNWIQDGHVAITLFCDVQATDPGVRNVTIRNNVITNMQGLAFQLDSQLTNIYIDNNTAVRSTGLRLTGQANQTNVVIRNNILTGSLLAYDIYPHTSSRLTTYYATNNLMGTGITPSFASVFAQSGNTIGQDPLFSTFPAFAAGPPASPAWEAGVTLAAVTTDFYGTARPQYDRHDIGAFELLQPEVAPLETPPVSVLTNPISVDGVARLFETSASGIEVVAFRNDVTAGELSGTWAWTGDLIEGTHFTLDGGNSSTWTIPDGDNQFRVTVLPILTGAWDGSDLRATVTLTAGAGYTVAGGPTYFRWIDAQQPPGVTPGPERPGQFRPPHTLP